MLSECCLALSPIKTTLGISARAPRSRARRRALVCTSCARGFVGEEWGGFHRTFIWAGGSNARRRGRVLRLRRSGSRFGGIPSFSAAVAATDSSAASAVATVLARPRSAIGVLGHSDHAGGLARKLMARHWPHLWQIVVPLAGSAAGQRIEGILPRQSALRMCSVSSAQPTQYRCRPPLCRLVGPSRPRPGRLAGVSTAFVAADVACDR
jgi:hypothetical protein